MSREPGRVWIYRPQWWWYGWATLLPVDLGHDEYARRVLLFGWGFTGRLAVAVWRCGDAECEADRIANLAYDADRGGAA